MLKFTWTDWIVTICLVVALALIALGFTVSQSKGAEPAERGPRQGDVYEVLLATPAATNELWIREVTVSLQAKDKEGLQSLADEGWLVVLKPGCTLRVLGEGPKFTTPTMECRIVSDGKAVGKCFVLTVFFAPQHRMLKRRD